LTEKLASSVPRATQTMMPKVLGHIYFMAVEFIPCHLIIFEFPVAFG
jgi:hypothetical protein